MKKIGFLVAMMVGLLLLGCEKNQSGKAPREATQLASKPASQPATAGTGKEASLSARLDLNVADALVGVPVLMEVTLTNTGNVAICYWCGGPHTYPNAERFRVTLTSPEGKVQEIIPSNGQFVQGSGNDRQIAPGERIKLPLAIAALAAGKWTLQLECIEGGYIDANGVKHVDWPEIGKTSGVAFTVRNDAKAGEQWEKELLARIRSGKDAFSEHVASHYGMATVLMALLEDLSGSDSKAALTAAHTLFMVRSLPPGTEKAVREAVAGQLKREEYKADLNLLAYLMDLAGHQPTDEMLESVLAVARSNVKSPGDEAIDHAVSALRYFPQKEAQEALHKFLVDDRQRIRDAAKNALEYPWPPKHLAEVSPATRP